MVKGCKNWSCRNLRQVCVSFIQNKGEKMYLNISSCFVSKLSTISGR